MINWNEVIDLIVGIIMTFILLIGGIKVFDWFLVYILAPWVRRRDDGIRNTSK